MGSGNAHVAGSSRGPEETRNELINAALHAADELCTAVIQGRTGQQRLALKFARTLDDARRAGLILTKSA